MRRLTLALAIGVLAVTASGGNAESATSAQTAEGSGAQSAVDPVAARARTDLARFTRWLAAGGRAGKGMIGEVGWPGDPATGGDRRWNRIAADWYAAAARARVWVAAWATGEFWAPSYKLLAYGASEGAVDRTNAQSAVIEAQRAPELRGINVAGAEFATPVDEPVHAFSNANRGTYGREYVYPSDETLSFLVRRGVGFVRLPIRWERLQPALGAPLDRAETTRLVETLEHARAVGLGVVLDVHNYGAYYVHDAARGVGVRRPIGSRQVSIASFASLWSRLARLVGRHPAVLGFGLMNEPVGMSGPRAWEAASRAAVRAIRGAGSNKRIFVQSYFWGGAAQFPAYHPRGPWIKDANTWYEAHQYFDRDRSARYALSYDQEIARARRGG